jgi:hypothetical protein
VACGGEMLRQITLAQNEIETRSLVVPWLHTDSEITSRMMWTLGWTLSLHWGPLG